MFSVNFYREEDGSKPVGDFIRTLDVKMRLLLRQMVLSRSSRKRRKVRSSWQSREERFT